MNQADTDIDDEIESPEVDEQEPAEVEQESEQSEPGAEQAEPEAESDEVVVTIGEESPPQEEERAPEWVRELRKRNQETVRENRELKKRLETLATPVEQAVKVSEKPTLEACEYDTDVFEAKLADWYEQKRKADEQERKKQEEGVKAQQAWQSKLDSYAQAKTVLKVSDYEDAEATAKDVLSVTQQGIILSGADQPAIVVYALGKNPKKAQELASITDPVKFAFAVAKLETQMKVSPRKTAPLPESTVRGNARVSAGIDSTLERLRAEADRTGDRTKVAQYMRQQAHRSK